MHDQAAQAERDADAEIQRGPVGEEERRILDEGEFRTDYHDVGNLRNGAHFGV